jgi:hypothetical protein
VVDYLKRLGEGWSQADDGSYVRAVTDNESLKVVRVPVEDGGGWVVAFCLNGTASYAHYHPSFKKLIESLKG